MKPNQVGRVQRIEGGRGVVERLNRMGVWPGIIITMTSTQPFQGPVTFRAGGTELALGYGIAQKVFVEIIE